MNNSELSRERKEYRTGIIYILFCQLVWGVLPVYWQFLEPIESWKIILYRILTMFAYSYIGARIFYKRSEIWSQLSDMKAVGRSFAAGVVLTANWSLYIWAMNSEHVIQASIGYFIEPIVICGVGIIFFGEKLTRYNMCAIVFAVIAIGVILAHHRQLPGVALGLASTWAIYSAIKKASKTPPLIALVYETLPFAIAAMLAIVYIEIKGVGALSVGVPVKYAALWLSGLVTVIPVTIFGYAAKKTSLLVIGLAQYISPTITLVLGIFLFKEPFDKVHALALSIIWVGLCFFSYGEFRSKNID